MNVMLTGYGRMGREIESILTKRGHSVTCKIDKGGFGDYTEVSLDLLKKVDVVIEFALPEGMECRIKLYTESKVPVIMGNTGWLDKLEDFKKIVLEGDGSFLYGTNFSIGVHMFWNIVSNASRLINSSPEYDIMMLEYHHNKKKDSPSGTAITTAEKIISNCHAKTDIWTDKLDREILPNELHVASVRGGYIPGTHSVTLDSPADTIEINHIARNRSGFAMGAVMAAEWMIGKKGFFTVEDFFNNLMEK
ncbi:MAG: 4-hydroxy-tetrahydrodipicolinate reductase [Spirochaetales bacterium]|nr:4-hydroxy-tetrahydrodipicolinate reductase [Spirochaetales bacterium]